MKVHINELKTGSKKGYKVRWTAEGKPKEKFRKNGRKGGNKKTLTENKETESNLSELNITDGITHGKPTGNGPYSDEDPY